MFCDALTLAAVVDELEEKVLGGRIQRVTLVDALSVGLEVYAHGQRHHLLISAAPEEGGRLHLMAHRLRRGPEVASPLLLRLRKQVRGGHLAGLEQPGLERIVRLTIESREGTVVLVAEVMGRRSNIFLVGPDGAILECARRVPASQNRFRTLMPGHLYVPPPPQKKADPIGVRASQLAQILRTQEIGVPLWRKLVGGLRGISPLLAREISYRATGAVDAREADAGTVLASLQELLGMVASGRWRPSVALEARTLVAYAPYALTHYPGHLLRPSTSQAMEAYYSQSTGADAYAVSKDRVLRAIGEQRRRLLRKRASLLDARPTAEALDALRLKGELLLAYTQRVVPGQEKLLLTATDAGADLTIALDRRKSAVENAQDYFRRYEKAKGAAAEVPPLLAGVKAELAHLDQLATDLQLAEDEPGIAAVESALAEAGYGKVSERNARRPKRGPLRVSSEEGFAIWVGRNSWQNEEVTFRLGSSDDLWLHARGLPGAHVILRTEGQGAPPIALQRAAELAAYYSAGRHEARVAVDYTLRRNVRRLKGGRLGQVVYKGQKTLTVSPRKVWC